MAMLAALLISVVPVNKVAAVAPGPVVGVAGKCLDNRNGATTDGNLVQIYDCNSSTQQQWQWTGDRTLRVQGKCLNASGTAVGSNVQITTCNTASTQQQWRPTADNSFLNVGSNLCLGTALNLQASGVVTQLKTCNALAATQRWDISAAVVSLGAGTPEAHKPLPSGPFNTPTPTINVDYSMAPEFKEWVEQTAVPFMEDWYPYLGDYYAYPDHAPKNSFNFRIDPTYTGDAFIENGQTIVMSSDYRRTRLGQLGTLVHEMTHVVGVNPATGLIHLPTWLMEGFAQHAQNYLYKSNHSWTPNANESYLSGYTPAAALLNYLQQASGDTFMKALAATAWDDAYTDNFFVTQTGHSIGYQWRQMSGQAITDPGAVTHQASNMCATIFTTTPLPGLYACSASYSFSQLWAFKATSTSAFTGQVISQPGGGRCLSVVGNGTANGTAVDALSCNVSSNPGQVWEVTSAIDTGGFTTLKNPNSGKCVQPVGGATASGTKLEIQPCTTATAQKWKFPTLYR